MNTRILAVAATAISLLNIGPVFALPQGEDVKAGQASFERQGNVLNIHQHTDKMIADYQSFSIGASEAVHFLQPSSSSLALNRVVGADPSSIFGTLTSTGKVFLINPNGVLFGPSSRVDTAGLVASTLGISNEDFLAGRYHFANAGGSVVNQGSIKAPGSFVALLGSHVENTGLITADLGSVAMASGERITVNLDPLGLISIAVDEALKNTLTGKDAVKNSGIISAQGGRVILTAKTLDGFMKNSVNNEGIISAASMVQRDGEIFLVASGPGAKTVNHGTLDAAGGFVEVSGEQFDLAGGHIQTSSLLLDPAFLTIDDALATFFIGQGDTDIVAQADVDVNFQISSKMLDLEDLLTKTFTVHAGRTINQNGNTVVAHGGNITFLADTGNINLSAPIQSNGGAINLQATLGNITHAIGADLNTLGGNYRGFAGTDYTVNNGVQINSGNGIMDIYAGRNIVLGGPGNSEDTHFNWNYISGDRDYKLREFGYYYFDGDQIVYIPLTQGADIGKDGSSLITGSGSLTNITALGQYTIFEQPGQIFNRYHTDPGLNGDGDQHILVFGSTDAWEDIFTLGDHDFNDAVINFQISRTNVPPGVSLSTNTDMFLTANTGSISQTDGNIRANNLTVVTDKGMSGTGGNDGLNTNVNNVSVLNKTTGNIRIANEKDLSIRNLTGLTGLNTGVQGRAGAVNTAPGGEINMAAQANAMDSGAMLIDAPVSGKGDIVLTADGNITHSAAGDVTIDNSGLLTVGPPKNVQSTSHQIDTWSNDPDIDVTWRLPDMPGPNVGSYSATAGGAYTMAPGSQVFTDSGNATVEANGNVALSLIDAANGKATITSNNGSILDNDLGVKPVDYDVIGHTILLNAPNGSVGGPGAGQEVDTGYPLSFSFLWDESTSSTPDSTVDPFTAILESSGEWLFGTTFHTPHDSDGWWFHIKTVDAFHGLSSSNVHLGPFLIDTIAPVITAGSPQGTQNPNGSFTGPVTVPFEATDERSGFPPGGSGQTTLPFQTTSTTGPQVPVTSGTVTDRAGNTAQPVTVNVNIQNPGNPDPPDDPDPPDNPGHPNPPGNPGNPGTSGGPGGQSNNLVSAEDFVEALDQYRVYYEILNPSQFLSFEPVTKIGLFAYHPLTVTDFSKLNEFQLDAGAYDFIQDNIKLKKQLPSFFQE